MTKPKTQNSDASRQAYLTLNQAVVGLSLTQIAKGPVGHGPVEGIYVRPEIWEAITPPGTVNFAPLTFWYAVDCLTRAVDKKLPVLAANLDSIAVVGFTHLFLTTVDDIDAGNEALRQCAEMATNVARLIGRANDLEAESYLFFDFLSSLHQLGDFPGTLIDVEFAVMPLADSKPIVLIYRADKNPLSARKGDVVH